jgi:hypothetical protein
MDTGAMADEPDYDHKVPALMPCQRCDREMRLGVEPLEPTRELYTF